MPRRRVFLPSPSPMNILDFIRRNSLLVLVVIIGVGAGLVIMDYSGKGSAFSRDFYIRVDDTSYSYQETAALGENGAQFLSSLYSATRDLAGNPDSNGDGSISPDEEATFVAWQREHPEIVTLFSKLNAIYSGWHYGVSGDGAVNVAINRAILKAEAEALGIYPTEAQIDEYLRAMPTFKNADGSFNTELYRRLTGFRHGNPNRVQEEAFRSVVADMMVWESLENLLGDGASYDSEVQEQLVNAFSQTVRGRTAWLPRNAVKKPDVPTEEQIREYWESHKEEYKSAERRIISVYTLTPAAGSNMDNLLYTTDSLMQELSQANGHGLDELLDAASKNPEFDPFIYKAADGSTHQTFPLSTQDELSKVLPDEVSYEGGDSPLFKIAFEEVADVPGPPDYEAAKAAGDPERALSIRHIRGFYTTKDDKLKLVRIDAVESPSVLPYEQARELAKTDLMAQREDEALDNTAKKLANDMKKAIPEKGLKGAFDIATSAGAEVGDFGPINIAQLDSPLPEGMTTVELLSTPSGQLTAATVLSAGARISAVTERTVQDSPALSMQKRLFVLPSENARLREQMIHEWQNAAFSRFNIQLSPSIRTSASKAE